MPTTAYVVVLVVFTAAVACIVGLLFKLWTLEEKLNAALKDNTSQICAFKEREKALKEELNKSLEENSNKIAEQANKCFLLQKARQEDAKKMATLISEKEMLDKTLVQVANLKRGKEDENEALVKKMSDKMKALEEEITNKFSTELASKDQSMENIATKVASLFEENAEEVTNRIRELEEKCRERMSALEGQIQKGEMENQRIITEVEKNNIQLRVEMDRLKWTTSNGK